MERKVFQQSPDFVPSDNYDKVFKDWKRAQLLAESLRQAVELEKLESKIRCAKCKEAFPIKEQTYIQTYWYTPPSGCVEGDYWNQGEANWECPSCEFRNRFDNDRVRYDRPNDYYRPELVASKKLFKKIVEKYKR